MKPGVAVRALAVDLLVRVERDRAFAAPLIAAREGALPPRDRPLLRTLVRSVLRHRALLDHGLVAAAFGPSRFAAADLERAALS